MTGVAVSLSWLAAAPPSPRPIERRRGRRVRRAPLPAVSRPTPLYAVSCSICDDIGPIFSSWERALVPPKNSGWRYLTIAEVGGWCCEKCTAKYLAMLPPPTRSDCVDGERPCQAYLCRYHLHFDRSRKAPHSFTVLQSCALDVADGGEHTLRELGTILGMTREGIREIELAGKDKLRAIPGIGFDFQDDVD